MKAFIALCLLFVSVYSASTFNAELDAPWTLFKRTFEKQYESGAEEIKRRSIWEDNIALIRKHNLEADLGLHTYTLGMNKYGDMTNEEFNKQMKGFNMSLNNKLGDDSQTYRVPAHVKLADSVDWRTKGYVTPVKDQGQCGSCWAFSSTGSLEGQHFAKTKQLVSLSEQNLVDCSQKYGNMGCNGGWMDWAFQYIKDNKGIDTEAGYPYQARTLQCRFDATKVGATDTGYVSIPAGNENALQSAIATVGPVSVAIDAAHSSFQLYRSGVYNEPSCSTTQLDHAVLAVGYDSQSGKEYYIVKNSWGTSWGNQGYIWMSRDKKNQCGIATHARYPTV